MVAIDEKGIAYPPQFLKRGSRSFGTNMEGL
jgi:hypothetical protein